ncbi:MAG: S-layer homology domain-containing protein, partial [Armatimonadetes bacterium]|nr:S-layer homology domain-containing protein [Armatimonadota bacterium]
MKKAVIGGLAGAVLALAVPVFAQGPFADVPVDHWAYEAVQQLQDKGIVIGYPDGTFSGKRALTRYEFALALSRAIPVICQECAQPVGPNGQPVTDAHINDLIDQKISKLTGTDVSSLQKSIDEFRDELSQMGVDLDALKRDVASLEERVAALEAEHKRLKITTRFNVFAIGASQSNGSPVDRDNRPMGTDDNLLKGVSVVRDADVIFNYEASGAKAQIVLNAGNYLNYLGALTNFAGNPYDMSGSGSDYSDAVNLFLGYGEVPLLGADVSVGRFPIQFTKWTLKKFDVDTYTENWKTDDGNYYVDGGKAAWTWGGVDILAFAGKNNNIVGGIPANYTALPAAGPGIAALPSSSIGTFPAALQSTGVRAAFGLGALKVGLNYINAGTTSIATPYDEAQVYGADLNWNWGSWKWYGAWTETTSNGVGATPNVSNDNTAWEVGTNGNWGGLGIAASYVRVEPNFAAPGDWRRIGRWQNPVNLQGPEVGLKYGISERWNVFASGAWYDGVQNASYLGSFAGTALNAAAKVQQYKAGVDVALGRGTLGFDAEWVRWDPNVTGATGTPEERYYT